MHVGINAQLLAFTGDYRAAGLSQHIEDLVTSLLALPDDTRYTLYVGPGARDRPRTFGRSLRAEIRETRWPTLQPEARIAWEQAALPIRARRDGLDLLHCPVLIQPLLASVPTVVTAHDLIFCATRTASRRRSNSTCARSPRGRCAGRARSSRCRRRPSATSPG